MLRACRSSAFFVATPPSVRCGGLLTSTIQTFMFRSLVLMTLLCVHFFLFITFLRGYKSRMDLYSSSIIPKQAMGTRSFILLISSPTVRTSFTFTHSPRPSSKRPRSGFWTSSTTMRTKERSF
ncbi:hypothetical protein QCA50_006004 [Cerrena zonata]|uniref:Uncharacterized protein n=1 Tax=Cerrena zonata TaxID=2478898 RepID=A0AAW0GGQ2_9APHY